jgi:hypothetical protein
MTSQAADEPGVAVILWELLIALDAARADVWEDGSGFHAGIREGLERAEVLVRGRLARVVEEDHRR